MLPKLLLPRILTWTSLLAVLAMAILPAREARGQDGRQTNHNPPFAAAAAAAWVGATSCAACHADAYEAWTTSHHALAMQAANEKTVLGNFNGARFTHAGIASTFFRRNGKFFVTTDGPDGKLADFEIAYTFGFTPLQQYLIALPGGRLQAFGVAWDARPGSQGGQRWFHLYPDLKLKAGNPLHWTGIDQNWNYQCADCHLTHFEKNYDAASRSFKSQWAEINVSCEACHGPGSRHVEWARGNRQKPADKGLTVSFDERHGTHWRVDPESGRPARSVPRAGTGEIETCARCHARRGQFATGWTHGRSFFDAYRPATLDAGLYWPDGQMRDEVYNYGSFLQSRMHAAGVTCADCHEPHSQKLRAPGNAVCAQCHPSDRYARANHHHHPDGKGAACIDCHMPTATYMQIDRRHDHSFRIPRPDLTRKLGVPNACNSCHPARTPAWAAAKIATWTGRPPRGYQRFAEALHQAASNAVPAAQAALSLVTVASDASQPAIARATALTRLGEIPHSAAIESARRSLQDPDAMVREAALRALSNLPDAQRARLLSASLGDPARTVRMEAARALAGAPERLLDSAAQSAFSKALAEYLAALDFDADRPEAHSGLGALHVQRGDVASAEREFRQAIEIDPTYSQASVNLADLYRRLDREQDADAALRGALRRIPREAVLHHALGLSLVRQQRKGEALAELGKAALLSPDNIRFAYVYAIALHDAGKRGEALRQLQRAIRRAPGNASLRQTLQAFQDEANGRPGR